MSEAAEQWVTVETFPDYEVSNLGRVRRGGRELKPLPCGAGYHSVTLYPGPRGGCRRYIHRLVLEAFVGPPPTPEHTAAHLNGNRTDNRASNLSWATIAENHAHKKLHGTQPNGELVWNAKLTATQVKFARARISRGERHESIARDFGVHRRTITDIALGKTWRHVA